MKDYRKSLPKPIRMVINFIIGLSLTLIIPYMIGFIWTCVESFVLTKPVDIQTTLDSIINYTKIPRLLTLVGIVIGIFYAFTDHNNNRYKKWK